LLALGTHRQQQAKKPSTASKVDSCTAAKKHRTTVAGLAFEIVRGQIHKHANAPYPLALLRVRRQRPHCRAANKVDEFAPPHGAYPKARDHGLSIAGHADPSQQKRPAHLHFGSMLLKKDFQGGF